MENLKNLNLEVLQVSDSKEVEGGGIVSLLAGAFLAGRRVQYMKNGGGFFDFYL